MVTIEPRHIALWRKADPLTVPGVEEKPPTYGAWHRVRKDPPVLRPEEDAPRELEGLAAR